MPHDAKDISEPVGKSGETIPGLAWEQCLDAMMVLDRAWKVLAMNPAAEAMLSTASRQLQGKILWQSQPQLLESPVFVALQQAMDQRQTMEVEEYFARPDRWYVLRAVPCGIGLMLHGRDVTQEHKQQFQQKQQLTYQNQLLAVTQEGILGINPKGQISFANPAAAKILGVDACALVGQTVYSFLEPVTDVEDKQSADEVTPLQCLTSLAQHSTKPMRMLIHPADRSTQPVEVSYYPLVPGQPASGGVMHLRCRRWESQVRDMVEQSRGFLRAVLDTLPTHMCIIDHNGTIIDVNQAWRGFALANHHADPSGGLGTNYLNICQQVHGETHEQAHEVALRLRELLDGKCDSFEVEYSCHAPNEPRWFVMRVSRLEREGQIFAVIGHDNITQRKLAEMRSYHDSTHDALTGLPNRVLFQQRLKKRLQRAHALNDHQYVVLFIDLDHFKNVNDSLGHNVGDELLRQGADYLLKALRQALEEQELPGDSFVLARQGGDEFMVLLEKIPSMAVLRNLLSRLQPDGGLAFQIQGHEVFTSASIGVVFGNAHYNNTEDLVRDGDTAMYHGQGQGRGRYELFDQPCMNQAARRMLLEQDLRKAIDGRQFELYYQPIFDLESGNVLSLEALVRWRREDGTYVAPNDFIPLAEETDLILPLGKWVVEEACRRLGQWSKTHPAAADLAIHVNLSQRQLCAQDNLIQFIQTAVETGGIKPQQLHLEITESAIMTNPDVAGVQLQSLRALGVKIDIDDFGTGYSSLSYLHRLPLDGLKIDRAFVANLAKRRDYPAVVQAIVALAHNLNMHVVAEGIETRDQLVQLQALECDAGQGYFFAKPLTIEGVRDLLTEKMARVA
ncbi:MAG: EAL domain-containing protein [Phycisphaerales bacterium]|nr:EAL domain-containing protein [Phycisphaerales bacterium]